MALAERFDLRRARLAGASAGALSASAAACEVDLVDGLETALQLTRDAGAVKDGEGFGLYGVWGGVVRSWLESILPADAHTVCSSRVHVAVKAVPRLRRPWFETQIVSEYAGRDDLLDAIMASLHIPYFMDKHATARFRGQRYIDGSFSIRGSTRSLLLPGASGHLCVRSKHDERIRARYGSPTAFLARGMAVDDVREMMTWGAEHIEAMDRKGELALLDPLRRTSSVNS